MKNFTFVLLGTLIVLLSACQEKRETGTTIEIHPDKFVEKQLKLSDVAETVEYIRLDTAWLIRYSWDLEITDKYIFIAARDELLQYDRNGKFIRTIGSKGQGPGEFSMCTNIAIDAGQERIFVRDWEGVMTYSFDGKFIGKTAIPLEGMVDVNYANGSIYGISMVSFTPEQLPYLWMKVDGQTGEVLQKKTIRV